MPAKATPRTIGKATIGNQSPLVGTMERIFDAPVADVFRAHTDPTQIPQWWGEEGLTTIVEILEPRTGGSWRFVQEDPRGKRHVFYGKFLEVALNKRIKWTFAYEPYPTKVIEEDMTFEDLGGRTRLFVASTFPDKQTLAGQMGKGMQGGRAEGWDRLAKVLRHG